MNFTDRIVALLDWIKDWMDKHLHWLRKAGRICTGDPYTLFVAFAKAQGMMGKFDINSFLHFGEMTWTLYGIVEKEGDVSPLTESIKRAFVRLAEKEKKRWESQGEYYRFQYKIASKPVTLEWIKEQVEAWENQVACFWAAYD